ncbi:hypothetical protein FB561_4308 [Kribbella amoyensis]|uniref:Uncharacterized protein n=1 Tax=Kribbella amoyensis TaxID=996641 RepID=A0A561BW84_9ACTN|nr:hypothetical protein [Kribbella amoyensis]TWD83150.1 hypothetical protein FB561_4308 [Kribbella amoyensis]
MVRAKRMLAVAGIAAAGFVLPVATAASAHATTTPAASGPVVTASKGTWGCGWNRPACVAKQSEFKRFLCKVDPIYYLPTSGYWFNWYC